MAAAKRRAIERLRRADVHRRKTEELGRELEPADVPDLAAEAADPFDDDVLRLIFTACHPVLSVRGARGAHAPAARRASPRTEIARAYLVPEATVQQRIVRAKRTLSAARVPIEVPEHGELPERLASVLEVDLPDLQRGLRRHRRRRVDAPGADRRRRSGSAACSRRCCRRSRRCTGCPR